MALFLTLLSGAALEAAGQSAPAPAPIRLTLEDALVRARTTSAKLASYQALAQAATESVKGAKSERWPGLDLGASYTRNSDVTGFVLEAPGQPARTVFPNIPNSWRTQASVTFPLYTGGRVGSQITVATEAQAAAASDRAAAQNDLEAETRVAYVGVLYARDNARVLANTVASYESHLQDARHRQEVGLSASHETLAVAVEREQAELARLQSENGAEAALANLLRLVGLPPGTAVELDASTLADLPTAESTEEMVARALTGRPELEALRARIRALDATQKAVRSVSRPQAAVQAGWEYSSPNLHYVPWSSDFKANWSVGVGINWKVFDGGRAGADTAQAQAQADALRFQLTDLEARIRLDVTTRRLDLDTARAGKAVTQRGIEAGRDALRVAKDRYQEGVAPSSDLLDAETRLLRAELDSTLADARIQMAIANLIRATGR